MPSLSKRCAYVDFPDPEGPHMKITRLIGGQGRSAVSGLVPHPPFNPCVRFSRTRLTDDLLDMVTQPSGSGRC